MNKKINELPLFMMPESKARISYKDSLLLYDNLDCDSGNSHEKADISALPTKLKFNLAIFCQNGDIKLTANMTEFVLHGEDFLVLITDTIISRFNMSADCRLAVMCLTNEIGAELLDADSTKLFLNNVYNGPLMVHIPGQYTKCYTDMFRLMKYMLSMSDFRLVKKSLQGAFITMASLICNQTTEATGKPASRQEAIFRQFMEEVRTNYKEHRDIAFYADRMCLSAKYLGRNIHDYTGRHATEIIKDYVILEAKSMLRSRQYTVLQIADELHFASASFFGRYFKEKVGCSPLQY